MSYALLCFLLVFLAKDRTVLPPRFFCQQAGAARPLSPALSGDVALASASQMYLSQAPGPIIEDHEIQVRRVLR
jgi:hypothetical protein